MYSLRKVQVFINIFAQIHKHYEEINFNGLFNKNLIHFNIIQTGTV